MNRAMVYFNPDNMMPTRINGTVESISHFYSIGTEMLLVYDPEHEDGFPYTIKGLEIFDDNDKMIFTNGDCTSKYKN